MSGCNITNSFTCSFTHLSSNSLLVTALGTGEQRRTKQEENNNIGKS